MSQKEGGWEPPRRNNKYVRPAVNDKKKKKKVAKDTRYKAQTTDRVPRDMRAMRPRQRGDSYSPSPPEDDEYDSDDTVVQWDNRPFESLEGDVLARRAAYAAKEDARERDALQFQPMSGRRTAHPPMRREPAAPASDDDNPNDRTVLMDRPDEVVENMGEIVRHRRKRYAKQDARKARGTPSPELTTAQRAAAMAAQERAHRELESGVDNLMEIMSMNAPPTVEKPKKNRASSRSPSPTAGGRRTRRRRRVVKSARRRRS